MDAVPNGGNKLSEVASRDRVSDGRPVEGGGGAAARMTGTAREEGAAREGESSMTPSV